MTTNFLAITEVGGELVSQAQVVRFHQRYIWAGSFCKGKDVLEAACGTGPGLGYLASVSKSLAAGDYSREVLAVARAHYGNRIALHEFDAQATPFADASFDVIILFEAIYYLPDAERFIAECRRLLRSGGVLLLATANRNLFDFNPSPFSVRYYNPPELSALLTKHGFDTEFFGGSPIDTSGLKSRVLRLAKKIAVSLNLIPGSMRSKRLLKRLVFGRLVSMPRELRVGDARYEAPVPIDGRWPDTVHQVLYCVAKLR
ncbi:MAG: class I SAM-dependent methyltransferase [Sulfuricella sp.]